MTRRDIVRADVEPRRMTASPRVARADVWLGALSMLVTLPWLTACGGLPSANPVDWFASDNRPKPAPLPEISTPATLKLLWQANVGSGKGYAFAPAVTRQRVIAAARDGTVAAFDPVSGKSLWRVNAGTALSGGTGADDTTVAVGSPEGEVVVLEADRGTLRWRARVSSEVLAAPVIVDDLVIVRATDSRIFALDLRDGKRRWVYQRTAPSLSVRSAVGMVAGRGHVFAGFAGGKLVAISLGNGGARWEGTVSLPKGATELERVTDVVGLPWLSDREICAVAYQGRIACFNIANGNQIWARDLSSSTGLSADSRFVFVTDDKGSVQGMDRAGGGSVWRNDRLLRRDLTAPLAVGRHVVLGDVQGFMHVLSRETGAVVGRATTDGSPIVTQPVLLGAALLLQTTNGGLYAYSVE